jgi:hypothetical protein
VSSSISKKILNLGSGSFATISSFDKRVWAACSYGISIRPCGGAVIQIPRHVGHRDGTAPPGTSVVMARQSPTWHSRRIDLISSIPIRLIRVISFNLARGKKSINVILTAFFGYPSSVSCPPLSRSAAIPALRRRIHSNQAKPWPEPLPHPQPSRGWLKLRFAEWTCGSFRAPFAAAFSFPRRRLHRPQASIHRVAGFHGR